MKLVLNVPGYTGKHFECTNAFNKSPYGGAFATTILISYWHFPGKSDFEVVFLKFFLFTAFVALDQAFIMLHTVCF